MDTEKDVTESEDPDWAYPLLRIVIAGAFLEITCTTVMAVFLRIGFVPKALEPVIDYFVVGAITTGCCAVCSILLYLWIRPGLNRGPNS